MDTRCDQADDCRDGSDEKNCRIVHVDSSKYLKVSKPNFKRTITIRYLINSIDKTFVKKVYRKDRDCDTLSSCRSLKENIFRTNNHRPWTRVSQTKFWLRWMLTSPGSFSLTK